MVFRARVSPSGVFEGEFPPPENVIALIRQRNPALFGSGDVPLVDGEASIFAAEFEHVVPEEFDCSNFLCLLSGSLANRDGFNNAPTIVNFDVSGSGPFSGANRMLSPPCPVGPGAGASASLTHSFNFAFYLQNFTDSVQINVTADTNIANASAALLVDTNPIVTAFLTVIHLGYS